MYEQIAANKRKTVVLFIAAFAFAALIGYTIGLLWGTGPAGLLVALAVVSVLSVTSYVSGDRIILASTRAKEVSAEEQPRLHNVVEGLTIAAGIPKPRVYVVPEQAPNAYATGRDPEHASIAVTEGLLATMNRVELEGVVAHELAHVQDRDILIGTVIATVVGAAVLLAEFGMRSWWWGGFRGRRGNDSNGGVVQLVIFAVGVALADPRTDRRPVDPPVGLAEPRVPRRCPGRDPHEVPPGPRGGAPEDRRLAGGDAQREQRDRAPVAQPALADRGGPGGAAGEAVRDAPTDRGADPPPRRDVTFRSRTARDPVGCWTRPDAPRSLAVSRRSRSRLTRKPARPGEPTTGSPHTTVTGPGGSRNPWR